MTSEIDSNHQRHRNSFIQVYLHPLIQSSGTAYTSFTAFTAPAYTHHFDLHESLHMSPINNLFYQKNPPRNPSQQQLLVVYLRDQISIKQSKYLVCVYNSFIMGENRKTTINSNSRASTSRDHRPQKFQSRKKHSSKRPCFIVTYHRTFLQNPLSSQRGSKKTLYNDKHNRSIPCKIKYTSSSRVLMSLQKIISKKCSTVFPSKPQILI